MKLPTLNCLRCGHQWIPRKERVILCPVCRSPKWNEPKKPKGVK